MKFVRLAKQELRKKDDRSTLAWKRWGFTRKCNLSRVEIVLVIQTLLQQLTSCSVLTQALVRRITSHETDTQTRMQRQKYSDDRTQSKYARRN